LFVKQKERFFFRMLCNHSHCQFSFAFVTSFANVVNDRPDIYNKLSKIFSFVSCCYQWKQYEINSNEKIN